MTSLVKGLILKPQNQHCLRRVALSALADTTETTSRSSLLSSITPCKTLFDLQLPEGRCVGLQLHGEDLSDISDKNHWIHALLHPDEVAFGLDQPSEYARLTFILGRLAMRQLLDSSESILRDSYGRPTVPEQYLGSISHKRIDGCTTGVALISDNENQSSTDIPTMGIGVDIEQTFSKRASIGNRVLTKREIDDLGRLEGVSVDEEVLLRFSIKESLYKAMHPLICQYVGCQEAEVTPYPDGTASVHWKIKTGAHERFDKVTVHWRRVPGNFFLTSASITAHKNDDNMTPNVEECRNDI